MPAFPIAARRATLFTRPAKAFTLITQVQNAEYCLTQNYVLRRIVDESVLVPVSPQLKHRDCLFVMNLTAQAVYEGISRGLPLPAIADELAESFEDAPRDALSADMQEILGHLLEIEAIRVKPAN